MAGFLSKGLRIYLDSGWPGDNYEATRSMRDRLIWKRYRPGTELFYLAFPEANMTRMHGLRVVQFHSSSFSENCRVLKIEAIQGRDPSVALLSVARIPKALTKILSPAVWKRG